jgi:hypothetical protein
MDRPPQHEACGVCSSGPEERSGELRMTISDPPQSVAATLTIEGIARKFEGILNGTYEGVLTCPDRRDAPMMLFCTIGSPSRIADLRVLNAAPGGYWRHNSAMHASDGFRSQYRMVRRRSPCPRAVNRSQWGAVWQGNWRSANLPPPKNFHSPRMGVDRRLRRCNT